MTTQTLIDPLKTALDSIVPAGVTFGVDAVGVAEAAFDYLEEGLHLTQAVVGRRNEFIAGRRCAREALTGLGHAARAIPSNVNGLPQWPVGATGSISHSRGLCCAVVASTSVMTCLGVDLEKTNRLTVRAMERVVHPLELNFVGNDQARGSLLFSVKEAFFKAQFPVFGAQPNFKDLALVVDTERSEMTVIDTGGYLSDKLRGAAYSMRFRYQFCGDYVVTLCWLPAA